MTCCKVLFVFAEVDLDATELRWYAGRCGLGLLKLILPNYFNKDAKKWGGDTSRGWGRYLGQETACAKNEVHEIILPRGLIYFNTLRKRLDPRSSSFSPRWDNQWLVSGCGSNSLSARA